MRKPGWDAASTATFACAGFCATAILVVAYLLIVGP